jgi:hypothetical protein
VVVPFALEVVPHAGALGDQAVQVLVGGGDGGFAAAFGQPAQHHRADHIVGLDLGQRHHVHAEAAQLLVKRRQRIAQRRRHRRAAFAVAAVQIVTPGGRRNRRPAARAWVRGR